MFEVTRYHDFSAGHRVVGHEGKCRFLHGHNYRVHFTCVPMIHVGWKGTIREGPMPSLDDVGRVIDFSVIKSQLCEWLERFWDHKMLLWDEDPMQGGMIGAQCPEEWDDSIVSVPFNPTAENMAQYLVETVGPDVLRNHNVLLTRVTIDETRKCSATYTLNLRPDSLT
jgi:6-pyruvoyltetrahydropterin/6-carboxytetrahydropterin synthase